jgi:predicted ATPase
VQRPSEVRLIGAAIYGPTPLGFTFLPLTPGVSVLFGANGAGKSRLVDAIASAAGRGSRAASTASHLFFEVSPPDEECVDWGVFYSDLRGAALSIWRDRAEAPGVADADGYVDWTPPDELEQGASPEEVLRGIVAIALPRNWWLTELVDEISDQHLFAARGRKRYIAARIDESTPHLQNVRLENLAWREQLQTFVARADELSATEISETQAIAELRNLPRPPLLNLPFGHTQGFDGRSVPFSVPEVVVNAGEFCADPLIVIDETEEDLSRATLKFLRAPGDQAQTKTGPGLLEAREGAVVVSPRAETLAARLSARASEFATVMLLDAPVIQCVIQPPDDWAVGDAVSWFAYDRPTSQNVPLEDLSEAQHRWATLAIKLALFEASGRRVGLVLLDEPEQALHSQARRHLVRGLKRLATNLDCPIVVASHSAELLGEPDFQLHHVSRDADGRIVAHRLRADLRGQISELGLEPADFLQLVRVFVLVEGLHDHAVFRALLGSELDAARAHIVPMHGAKSLSSTLDSELIFDCTDARVVAVLDNIPHARVSGAWSEAVELAKAGRKPAGIAVLRDQLSREASGEERWLRNFGMKAIENGQYERIGMVGLTRGDIIEYLPVEKLVPGASSWERLRREWNGAGEFKAWLKREKNAPITVRAVVAGAQSLKAVPDDLRTTIDEIRRVAAPPRPRS